MRLLSFVVAVALIHPWVTLAMHHGTAASYDQEAWITVEGTVTEFYWRNPHSALFLEISDEDGNLSEYGVELASPTLMVQQGYNRNIFKPGDEVAIRVHPSKVGAAVGECLFSCQILVNGEEPEPDRQ
jgi:hypothetical protein